MVRSLHLHRDGDFRDRVAPILMIQSRGQAHTGNQSQPGLVTITSIKRSKRSSGRVAVHFADGSTLILPLEVVMTSGLRVGLDLDDQRLEELRASAERWRCRESALRLVAFRPRSQHELRGRLLRRGFDSQDIDAVVEDLTRAGLLDDAAFAAAFAHDRLRQRPVAHRLLVAELRSRGIDEATARSAAQNAYSEGGEDDVELARRAARRFRRRRGEDDLRAKKRFFALLARRGFQRETIEAVAKEFLG